MRSKTEIEINLKKNRLNLASNDALIIELLLDIREILEKSEKNR